MLGFLKPAPDAEQKISEEKVPRLYKIWQTRVLISTAMVYIGYYIIRLIFTVQQNDISKAYGFSMGQIGTILSMFGIGYGISKLIMGTLADRANPNRYVATGLIVSSIINALYGTTQSFGMIVFLMLLNSVMQGMGAAACQRLVGLWFGRKGKGSIMARGTAFSIWSSAHNAGAFMCVAVINLSALFFGASLQWSFWIASIVSIIIAVIVLFLGSDRPTTKGLPTIEEYSGDKVVIKDGEVVEGDVSDENVFKIFFEYIVKNKLVWAVILTSLSIYVVRYGIMSWIPNYLVNVKGFDNSTAKWLTGIFELAAVPGVIIIGFITDLLRGRRAIMVLISLIAMLACLITYFAATNHTLIIIVLLIMGTFIYAPATIVGLMVNEAVPKFANGMSTGTMGFCQYIIGEVTATLVIGWVVQSYGWSAGNIIVYAFAGIAILASIYILIYQNKLYKKIDNAAEIAE
ncbi:MFS transporter [Lactococcus cremoris]|jgi:OPA family glycerol-3-phosphate transporter-like MFS transporter|uniref:MFS transporter n=2 Tax=Lactococcus lactis subsp. cremoris TaxID=1359 RepID=UPI0006173937|nr:MFS transporter [Lactococcus cremoris]KZK07521.1 Glycerol-3-phosphate transporter [Lactococcus cremoris]MCI1841538.1 MFS transporter [Lactococcus lactis]MDU8930580.1 Phosphoglycerate transporter protein [Lactococcus cremoris]BDE08784.1 MFS transporter [Lactococcus cremoris]